MGPFGCVNKPAEKHRWLICCERKTMFRLKNKLKSTDYKSDEYNQYFSLTINQSTIFLVMTYQQSEQAKK
jgi:hypothetical protein